MVDRLRKRKVKVILKSRDPADSIALLRFVESDLRPNDLEIHHEPPDVSFNCPDEQLETAARSHAAEVLDRRDQEIRNLPSNPPTSNEVTETSNRVRAWLSTKSGSGWWITVKIITIVKAASEIAKNISDALGSGPG